ncbi:MAG: DNA repair protein RadA [Calditrichia bacterium]|nr:DNA repair protein RadA [Calditrichia bacterium]
MKNKSKTIFVCQQCGHTSAKWLGKCPGCESWSSFQEEIQSVKDLRKKSSNLSIKSTPLLDGKIEQYQREKSNFEEFDRTIGGGMVPGSAILIGGDPGIGKSTLMLQLMNGINENKISLYVSGEESHSQILMRANRIGATNKGIHFSNETNVENLLNLFSNLKPEIIIIDSIQTLYSSEIDSIPGNISQLRMCANELLRYTKENGTTLFLIGHVTKDGSIAGPKVLEHMVDTVLYFEGDNQYDYRILRSVKNRFGPVNEIGLFRMSEIGLETVANPSELFLENADHQNSGNAVTALLEGNRTILIQVQALVTKTQFGNPQRTATGIDHRRMNLLLAVLEKRCGKPFAFYDVFLKAAGGLRIDEPAADLGICMALISSFEDKPLPAGTVYIGEVGLNGEIRNVNRLGERIKECLNLGYKNIFAPSVPIKIKDVNIKVVKNIQELQ